MEKQTTPIADCAGQSVIPDLKQQAPVCMQQQCPPDEHISSIVCMSQVEESSPCGQASFWGSAWPWVVTVGLCAVAAVWALRLRRRNTDLTSQREAESGKVHLEDCIGTITRSMCEQSSEPQSKVLAPDQIRDPQCAVLLLLGATWCNDPLPRPLRAEAPSCRMSAGRRLGQAQQR